jgi:fructose-1,6-bisphosphatase II / sedoheptulose-1,7-bisphosphatase
VRLISDGDVAGVIHVAEAARTGIDVYMGIGGAPEGVLAAAALKCLGGQIEGRLVLRSPDDAMLARMAGITAPDQIFKRDDMIGAEVVFAATGVTDGALLHGIRQPTGQIEAETLLMRSRTGSVRFLSYRKKLRQVAV